MKDSLIDIEPDPRTVIRPNKNKNKKLLYCMMFVMCLGFCVLFYPREMYMEINDIGYDDSVKEINKQVVFYNPNIYPRVLRNVKLQEYYRKCLEGGCEWNLLNSEKLSESVEVPSLGYKIINTYNNISKLDVPTLINFATACIRDELYITYRGSWDSNLLNQEWDSDIYRVNCIY